MKRDIEKLRVEGPGSSFVLGDMEFEAEGEQSPRPERVHPPRTKSCNCEVGLFKQLREMVARGEVLERKFMAEATEVRDSAALFIEFEHGQLQGDGREWQGRMNPELRKLAEALLFSGRFSVLMVGGRILSTGYVEDFAQARECRQ